MVAAFERFTCKANSTMMPTPLSVVAAAATAAAAAALQVAQLQKQYEEIAALAAAAGLQLEDPLTGSPLPKKQQGAAAAAAPAVDAPAKGPQPKAIEVAEGDRKVSVCVHPCFYPVI